MTQADFVKLMAYYVCQFAPKYGVRINSVPIAQGLLESGYGTSELATNAFNFHGLKYKQNVSGTNVYYKNAVEQRSDGSYYNKPDTAWCKFNNMQEGVEGYFKFISSSRYDKMRAQNTVEGYLNELRESGYATSLTYKEKLFKVINQWNLTQYDAEAQVPAQTTKTEDAPTQIAAVSKLSTYNRLAACHGGPKTHAIDTITIHCYVGQVTAKQGVDYFATTDREASCNYVIGRDGSIGCSVPENYRSFCSSNRENDDRAITIECASETYSPYAVTDACYSAILKLLADVCRRNNIKKLLWQGDPSLIGQVDKQNMTVHRWFKAKACPGDYLYSRMGEIAERVNMMICAPINMGGSTMKVNTPAAADYTVKIKEDSLNIRQEPTMSSPIVGTITDHGIYTIVETKGSWGKLKSGIGWINISPLYVTKEK